jgi:glycosyltransferase involved in cell wall biosynthesis
MAVNRILHCAETIKGGIASYLRDLIVCQVRDFGADHITVVIPQSQLADLPLPPGVRVLTFQEGSGRAVNASRLALRVAKEVLSRTPDVVHIHSTFAGATVRPVLAMLGLRKRAVYCPHGWAWDRKQSRRARVLTKVVERALVPLTARIICISEHEKKTAEHSGFAPKCLSLVVNGIADQSPVPAEAMFNWPSDKKRLLFVGRFDLQKGVDLFCQALNELGEEAHGVLAGSAVVDESNPISIPANASVVGWVNPQQLQALFETADVLVVPSRWEGFGLIAAEAMRAGLPVIAARVGGLTEVVAHGESGVLFEPGHVEQIISAVRSKTPEQWAQMGIKGRQRFQQHFSIERVHAQLTQVYQQICGQAGPVAIKAVLPD